MLAAFRAANHRPNAHVIEVMGVLAAKVRNLLSAFLAGLPIGQRVLPAVASLKNGREAEVSAATGVVITGRQPMEIAIMLNVSRETVTRVFQSLQNRQMVGRVASKLEVINPA